MYKTHATIISEHALKTPQGLLNVITFTFSTIQQPLSTSLNQLNDIDVNGIESKYLFGSKRAGLKYARENIVKLFWDIQELKKESLTDVEIVCKAVRLFMEIPGLGCVKASFVCQMLGFNVACIDSHNLERLGMALKDVTCEQAFKNHTTWVDNPNYQDGNGQLWGSYKHKDKTVFFHYCEDSLGKYIP